MHFLSLEKFKRLSEKYSSNKLYDFVMVCLFTLLICCLAIVGISQVVMRTKTGRVFLSHTDDYESLGVYSDYNNAENCYVDVILTNCKEQDLKNVSVYVNGELNSAFEDVRKRIYVTSQSVIEIKNNNNYAVMCEAESFGDGIECILNNEKVSVKGTSVLLRVILK